MSQDVEKCALDLVLSSSTRTNTIQTIALASKGGQKFLQDPLLTGHRDPLVCAWSRVGLCRRRAARRAAVAPSSGRLWAGTAVTVLTSRPARALGRALHSPGLDWPPPWLRGRCSLCCSAPADKGGRCGPDGIEHQVQKLYSGRLSHWIPIAACRGKLCQH